MTCRQVSLVIALSIGGGVSLAELPNSQEVVSSSQQSVVKLFGAGVGNLDSYGSGVLITQHGHVATVWNHLVNTGFLTAVTADGHRYSVQVVGTSLDHDLAILKLDSDESESFPFVDWKSGKSASPGDSVFAFSNVYHVATGNEPVSVMHGVVACETPLVAGLGRWKFPVKSPVYLLDAVTNNSGAAGGLLTTSSGIPLGLLGREIRHRETEMWVNYAVPWKTLAPAITAILEGRRLESTKGNEDKLMVSDRRLTSEFGLTVLPGILEKTPAYLDRIIPKSPAAAAGLARGDLVLMVNDDVVQSVDDLRAALAKHRKGQRVTVTVNRRDALEVLTLRIP